MTTYQALRNIAITTIIISTITNTRAILTTLIYILVTETILTSIHQAYQTLKKAYDEK